MRRRRYYPAKCLYEITIRTKEGLPFAVKELITLLIKSALARTQRDVKVYLCHFLWMGNHAHFLVISRDAKQLTKFYGELQKRMTDYMKRLLGLDHLELWEGDCSVSRVGDFEAGKERIAYFYANPAKANLVDTISEYPGYSSYGAFVGATPRTLLRVTEKARWIRCPAVSQLPTRDLSERLDARLVSALHASSKKVHRIILYPNLWMSCFGVNDQKTIDATNRDIHSMINAHETSAREVRSDKGFKPLGAKKLREQPIMLAHRPKKYSRRIFIIARSKEIRVQYIKLVDNLCKLCTECYERWKRGDFAFIWPPGTFPPPFPMSANVLG